MSNKAGNVISVILIILSLLLIADGVFVASLDISYYQSCREQAALESAGGSAGFIGLGQGIALVLVILFGIPGAVVAVISLILAILLVKRSCGWRKCVGWVGLAVAILFIICIGGVTPLVVSAGKNLLI